MSDYQRRLYQQQYIDKLHKASSSQQLLIPESRFIGPSDIGSAIGAGDEEWGNFLSNQQVRGGSKRVVGGGRTLFNDIKNLIPNRLPFNMSAGTVGKGLALGIGTVWAANKVLSYSSDEKSYGLTRQQQDIVDTEALGPKYNNLTNRFKAELREVEDEDESKRRFNLAKLALEKYGRKVGTGHKRILLPYEMLSKEQVEDELGFVPVNIAIPEAGQTTFTSYRHPDNLYHLHQHKDYWTMHKDRHAASTMLAKKRFAENKDNSVVNSLGSIGDFFTGLPHVVTEGIPGLFYYLKGQVTGTQPMQKRLLQETPSEYNKVLSAATGRWHGREVQGLGPYNLFSGFDDDYNTIVGYAAIPTENRPINGFDGMPHGGLSSEQRRTNTPFGSKYDRVRALASSMGETFESITRSKEFRASLAEARVVKELGAGTFGKAELMETTFQGEKLQFVRKRLHEGIREKIFREAANPEKYLGSLSLRHEGTLMSKLGTTEAVPSVYQTSEKELFMEAMPGTEIYKHMDKGGQVPQDAIAKLRKTAQEAADAGIENLDIHQGNIMFDPATQRISWIDWGQAQSVGRAATPTTMEEKLVAATTPTPISTTPTTPVIGKKKKRAQIAKLSNNTPVTPIMKKKRNKFAQVPIESQEKRTVIGRKKVPEGMMHGGMAASKRKATTEFGSGWRGLFGGLSGKIKKFWGKADQSAEKLLDPRRAAKMAENQSLEDFAKQLGGDIRVLGQTKYTGTEEEIIKKKVFEEMAIKQGAGAGFVPGDMIYIHPETAKLRAIEKAKEMGIDESLVQSVVKKEDFMKTLLYHEYLEKQSMARFGGAMKMAGPGAKHQAGQVIFGEAGFVSQLKDENIKKFFTQLRKTKTEEKTFAAGFDAFSKNDVAAELRPLLTDFASPWRGLIDSVSIKASQTMASQSGRASRKLLESSYDLKKAQEQLWDLANNAGKGHSKYAGKHVKQLSRFGGNL